MSSPQAAPTAPAVLVYGAYGYTGELIARLAAEQRCRVVLAGRNPERTAAIAGELGMPHRVFGLDDEAALDQGLQGISVVLHCAGPFARTSPPMVAACLRTGTHYLDITGEVTVFETCAARGAKAAAAGVMLLPGVGFDVVPSDCLAAHLKRRLPGATRLDLAFMGLGGGVSHGTATTMVENLSKGSAIRKAGRLHPIRPGSLSRDVDFGRGPKRCIAIPWGDISTAYHSTGIPDIAVYIPLPRLARFGARLAGFMPGILGSGPAQRFLKKRVDARPAGPDAEQRKRGKSILWGEAVDETGARVEARLTTPEGYTLTAMAGLDIALRVANGEAKPGFQTPSMLLGADYVTGLPGVARVDL